MGNGQVVTTADDPADEIDDIRAATQEALDATATAYTEDGSLDVEARLREEMERRGLDLDDEDWLVEAAHHVRSGHHVSVTDGDEPQPLLNEPGSLGGDNGGA